MTSWEFHGRPSVDHGAGGIDESIRLDRVVIITDQGRVPPRKKKTVDRDRIYDATMRRKEQAVGRWHDPRNKSLTRRFRRENAYGADNFEFRSHDPTMSGCRRGISQTRTLSYESSKWSRRRMNLGKVRDETLEITKRVRRAVRKRELGPPSKKAFLFTDKSI